MYLNALEFLEDERDRWRAYESLDDLSEDDLSVPVHGAHGWSGRDLMGHLVAWQEHALAVARELAVGETSPTKERMDADWDARADAINEELQVAWAALPIDEVRRRFRTVPGELRGYLTVVPETRWIKNADFEQFFLDETIDHYEEHGDDLAAILAARGTAPGPR